MDNEAVEKLIEIVRAHVFLFDVNHQEYKNFCLKAAIWSSIGRQLNQTDETVRNKWKTIRDGYTKYKKQLKSSKKSGRKNARYTWATQLSFLDSYNLPRAPSPHTQTPTLDSDDSQYLTLQNIPSPLSSPQILPLSEGLLPESSTSTCTALRASISRVSSRNNERSSENRMDDDVVGRLLQLLYAEKKKELDIIDNLFLSYADTFKKFPQREQALVKLELAKLFSNTELQIIIDNTKGN